MKYDVAIIGGGVVGALTARELMKYKLSFVNGKILLECGGQFSANHVIDIFSSSLESNNIKESSGSLLDIEKEPLTVGSDLI